MMIETNPENTVYGSYGELDATGTADWTDADWAEYDRYVAEEMAQWDEDHADDYLDFDPEPPF